MVQLCSQKPGPADHVLTKLCPKCIHCRIQLGLPLILYRIHRREEIELTIPLPGQFGNLNAYLPQRCFAIPDLIKNLAGSFIEVISVIPAICR